MKDKQCDVIRRELEELPLNEEFGGPIATHLRGCADCCEFQRQQLKLRQIVGSLGTVNAPADFDFRLRARLAADSQASGFRYWSLAVRGLATVAVLVVFGVGAAIVWQSTSHETTTADTPQQGAPQEAEQRQPEQRREEASRREEPTGAGMRHDAIVAQDTSARRNAGRPIVNKPRQPIATRDSSSIAAKVHPIPQPALDTAPVFPIDAALQSVKVSVDDGHGNARTISFPTITFGSQRVLVSGNQLASQRVW